MSKKSISSTTTDEATYNGELHGELYSPEYAVHINTEEKLGKEEKKGEHIGKGQQQGELYSPRSAIQTSVSSQQKQQQDSEKVKEAEGQDRKKAKGVERTKKLSQPSSKL